MCCLLPKLRTVTIFKTLKRKTKVCLSVSGFQKGGWEGGRRAAHLCGRLHCCKIEYVTAIATPAASNLLSLLV